MDAEMRGVAEMRGEEEERRILIKSLSFSVYLCIFSA
jgi:hypothetical protein